MSRWTYRPAKGALWEGTFIIEEQTLAGQASNVAVGLSERNARLICGLRNAWDEVSGLVFGLKP